MSMDYEFLEETARRLGTEIRALRATVADLRDENQRQWKWITELSQARGTTSERLDYLTQQLRETQMRTDTMDFAGCETVRSGLPVGDLCPYCGRGVQS